MVLMIRVIKAILINCLYLMAQFKYVNSYPEGINNVTLTQFKSELNDIAFKYGTDKCYINSNNKNYLVHLEEFMKYNRKEAINLLEIGVRDGPGVKTFNEYFYNAKNIIGVDINRSCKQYEDNKIKIIIGDINNNNTSIEIEEIMKGEKFDYILDDGSHDMDDIKKTFDIYWSKLKSQGWYIIEDLNNPYKKNQVNKYEALVLSIIHMLNSEQNTQYDTVTMSPQLMAIRKI